MSRISATDGGHRTILEPFHETTLMKTVPKILLTPIFLAHLALTGGNLLKNGDFEDAAGAAAWYVSCTGNGTGGISTGVAFEGQRSGFIRKLTDLGSHVSSIGQTVPCEPETEYFQSAWVKGGCTFFTYLFDAHGNYAGQGPAKIICNGNWRPVVNRFKVGKSIHSIQFRMERYGRGIPTEAWMDNAILARADEVPPPPGPVTDLVATLVNGAVTLEWTAPETTARLRFLVLRSRYPDLMETATPLAIAQDECRYVDSTIPADWPRVFYRVVPVDEWNQMGTSDAFREVRFTPALPTGRLVARAASPLEKTRLYTDIPETEAPATLNIELARYETEAMQLLFSAVGGPVNGVDVTVGDFTRDGAANGEAAPRFTVTLRRVDYVPVKYPNLPVEPGLMADPLSDWDRPVDIPEDATQAIWFEVATQSECLPGTYCASLSVVSEDGFALEIPVTVTVWDFELPLTPTFHTSYQIWGGPMFAKPFGLEPDSPEYVQLMKDAYEFLLQRRISPCDLPVPFDSPEAEKYFNDPRATDFRIPCGFWRDIDWKKFQRDADIARSAGVITKTYNYCWDEPVPAHYPHCRELYAKSHKLAPDVAFLLTEPPCEELKDHVDIWCPVLHEIEWDKATAACARGDHFWWYNCVGPIAPYPTYYIDDLGHAPRVLQWLQFKFGVEGNLYWCTNYWTTEDVWTNPATWGTANGEGFLFYPDKEKCGLVTSLRLEAIRDGNEDYEYLNLLATRLAKSMPPEIARARAAAMVEPVGAALTVWNRSPEAMLQHRRRIAQLIIQLGE